MNEIAYNRWLEMEVVFYWYNVTQEQENRLLW